MGPDAEGRADALAADLGDEPMRGPLEFALNATSAELSPAVRAGPAGAADALAGSSAGFEVLATSSRGAHASPKPKATHPNHRTTTGRWHKGGATRERMQ